MLLSKPISISAIIAALMFGTAHASHPAGEKVKSKAVKHIQWDTLPSVTLSLKSETLKLDLKSFDPEVSRLVLTADNLTHWDWDITDISLHLGQQPFDLEIKGLCAGLCARVLLPLANNVTFLEGSFAALTDSAALPKSDLMTDINRHMRDKSGQTKFSRADANMTLKNYRSTMILDYPVEVELLRKSRSGLVTHLTWQTYERQRLRATCSPPSVRKLGVVLTRKYLSELRILPGGYYSLPFSRELIDKMHEAFGPDMVVMRSYEDEPLTPCKSKFRKLPD